MTGPIPYVPVTGKPWRLAMGLRPLPPAHWLEVDDQRDTELQQKDRLLAERHDVVFAAQPGSERAGQELLELVSDDLDQHHPGLVTRASDGRIEELATGRWLDPGTVHPLEVAGRLVQEDLCVMEAGAVGWVLTAASVCFPSRWSLPDKIGRDLSAIHGPVPGYQPTLARPTEAFFDRLTVERPMWRLNWTLIDTPELHLPSPKTRHRPAAGAGPFPLWFRVERQTFRRLRTTGAVVFTIRTYRTPLECLVRDHPGAADALAATLATVTPDSLTYKGWTGVVDPVLQWLALAAEADPSGEHAAGGHPSGDHPAGDDPGLGR